jgi:hypothetical protein
VHKWIIGFEKVWEPGGDCSVRMKQDKTKYLSCNLSLSFVRSNL